MKMLNTTNITVAGRFLGGALFTPKETNDQGKMQYTLTLALDDGEEVKLEKAVEAAILEKWGTKIPAGMQNWAVRKGEDPEFEHSYGKYFINAKANTVSAKGKPLARPATYVRREGVIHAVEEKDGVIYAGCYVAVELSVYAYDEDKARRIKAGVSVGFNKVLFRKHGVKLTSQTSAETAFNGFDSDEEDDSASNDDAAFTANKPEYVPTGKSALRSGPQFEQAA
jgi:hypothetical protein